MLRFLLNRKTKKLLKNTNREKAFINWSQIHRILIVFDTNDYEEVDAFVEYLEKNGKKVNAYAFKNKSDNYDYSDTPYLIVSKKETNDWTGESFYELTRNLEKETYDLALDLNLKRNAFLESILVNANAYLKAGYKKSDLPFYDLTITSLPVDNKKTVKPVMELARQVLYYLSTIEPHS